MMHVATAVVTCSGIVYAWMKYFAESDDPFSVVNHPWQPTMLHLHVIFAPLLVFALGWITSNHIVRKYRSKKRDARRSGIVLIAMSIAMVASGYLIQITTNEGWLRAHEITHWISSGIFALGYLAHQLVKPAA